MRHLLRAFFRLMSGASWKKGHFEQSALNSFSPSLSGHEFAEYWHCDGGHDCSEHEQYDEIR